MRKALGALLVLPSLALGLPLRVGTLTLDLAGWQLTQQSRTASTLVLGARRSGGELLFLASPSSFDLGLGGWEDPHRHWQLETNGLNWEFAYVPHAGGRGTPLRQSVVFRLRHQAKQYAGYITGEDAFRVYAMARDFVAAVTPHHPRSLTEDFFFGKKYYLGFGDYLSGFMGNEVKYDIAHTHDIFTTEIGGNYTGTKIHGSGQGASKVRSYWRELEANMLWNDMYVQYSAGHGHQTGLEFGLSYNEMRDAMLRLPAKETIVFIMACHSGGLVNAFNAQKHLWESWGDYNRTLFVMASSRVSELSSTGPGTDHEEPGGPNGSAGSAFGHALWKALIGHADGYNNSVKAGLISLGEIIDYTVWRTKSGWGHTPVYTGVYDRNLIINRVPTEAELRQFENGTEGLSEDEIAQRIRELDEALRR